MVKKVAHFNNYSNTIPSILLSTGAHEDLLLAFAGGFGKNATRSPLAFYQNLLLLDAVEVAVPEAELDVFVEEELLPKVAINGPMVRLPHGG
jgi:hypothetical protein